MNDFLEKTNSLPKEIKKYLISTEIMVDLERACFIFNIPYEKIENISSEIGLAFVGDIKLEDLPKIIAQNLKVEEKIAFGIAFEINKRIFNQFPEYFKNVPLLLRDWESKKSAPMISEEEAQKKVYEVEPWIMEEEEEKRKEAEEERRKKDEERRKVSASLVRVRFSQALKNYPEFGEQLVTTERIKLQGFPETVRPSIKNWIADYTSFYSYDEEKNSINRGQYLFNSPNGRRLSERDHAKLSFMLKAFDEDATVAINKDTRTLLYEEAKNISEAQQIKNRDSVSFGTSQAPVKTFEEKEQTKNGEISYSYPQKMAFEKKPADSQISQIPPAPQALTRQNIPPARMAPAMQQPAPNFRKNIIDLNKLGKNMPTTQPQIPKNVVNLREE